MSQSDQEIDELIEDFADESIDKGVVWGIAQDDEWAVCQSETDDDQIVLPFWSSSSAAKKACCDEWKLYKPQSIELDDFIDNWLHGMSKDDVLVGVNWDHELNGIEVEPLDLIEYLLETD